MRINVRFALTFCSLLFIVPSCSIQESFVQIPEKNISVVPFETDGLITTPKLVLSEELSLPAEFTPPPAIEISDQFIGAEKYLVRAKTEKLFDKRTELLLDLGQIDETSFTFPLPGARILSPYGTRRGRNHTGIDIKTFPNDSIRAAFDGIVRIAGKAQGYGNVIVIRHYNGLETVYGHNSRLLVKTGDKVKAGTPISLEGRTGRATTEHLHFETRINGQHFDPSLIIDFVNQKLHNTCIVFTPEESGKIRIDRV